MARFSIKQAVSFGWDTTLNRFSLFLGLVLIPMAIGIAYGIITNPIPDTSVIMTILDFGYSLIMSYISVGVIQIMLRLHDGQPVKIGDVFVVDLNLWLRYFITTLLYGLLVAAGFILLVIPGIYWSMKYLYVGYLIVDRKCQPLEAFRLSSQITQGTKLKLLGFSLVQLGIIILGVLALLLGLFVAVPVVWLSNVFVYRVLSRSLASSVTSSSAPIPPVKPQL